MKRLYNLLYKRLYKRLYNNLCNCLYKKVGLLDLRIIDLYNCLYNKNYQSFSEEEKFMAKVSNMKLKVSNDNGNSEHSLYINGDLVRQPNVYVRPTSKGFVQDVPGESLIPTLLSNIDVTVQSPSIKFNRRYYIGNRALNSKYQATEMNISLDKKYNSDLPIINTLGTVAAKAVQDFYNKNQKIPQELDVTVDMLTALPVKQWNPENAKKFSSRFTDGPHTVTVHINTENVLVKINFETVKVAPEGTPAIFSAIYNLDGELHKGEMFRLFKETYGRDITGQYLINKRVAHVDVGDGTCDTPVSIGFNLDHTHVDGCNNGVGHAIKEAMVEFNDKHSSLTKLTRQKFSEYLKDTNHQYHQDAVEFFNESMVNQAEFIYDHFRSVLEAYDNEVDLFMVYGGGSIVMKDALFPLLKELADDLGKELLWIPEEYAALMNTMGLQVLLNNMKKEVAKG